MESSQVILLGDFVVEQDSWNRVHGAAPDIPEFEQRTELTGDFNPESAVVVLVTAETFLATAVRRLRKSRGGVIKVGSAATPDDVLRALEAGAKGFVQTESPVEELITAIRAVIAGYHFVPPAFLPALANTMLAILSRDRRPGYRKILTDREFDVLGMLAKGYTNAEIAERLYISVATVRTHVMAVLRKIGARNRTEAVAMANQKGLLLP